MIERMKFLVNQLNTYTKAYDEGTPLISDQKWDKMYWELKGLEDEMGVVLSNSPTQSISYEVVNALKKVEHNHKMLSLEKTKSPQEVVDFVGNKNFLTMCKMDGLTCSLTYRDGELVSAETRGNGFVGEDVLHNAKTLSSIPNRIPYTNELIIDGEIICTYADFEKFSNEYKNPRNFAAGSIRLLDAKECARRGLTFVAWDVITPMYSEDRIEYRLSQKLDYLTSFGFTIVPFYCHSGFLLSPKVMGTFIEDMRVAAKKNDYPIDGVVIKFDDCEYGRSLGSTAHHFRNAIAFKFFEEESWSELKGIEWSLGKTGQLSPVALFEPIDLDGSTVARASLHNVSVMHTLFGEEGPRMGQPVCIFKANDIIPQIRQVGPGQGELIEIPHVCPICGGETKLIREIESDVLYCINKNCDGKLINKLKFFCGKNGLDIKGLSEATLTKLIDWGWIKSFKDVFTLGQYRGEWVRQSGFGEKSVDKILSSIEASSVCEPYQLLSAISVPLVGLNTAKDIIKHFGSWESFIKAVNGGYKFYDIPNIGIAIHDSLSNFDYCEACLIADSFLSWRTSQPSDFMSGANLSGKVFVVTGKLHHFKNRDELKAHIEALGGKVTGSVSKNTNYLINNDATSTSSKNKDAKAFGVDIITEDEFLQLIDL